MVQKLVHLSKSDVAELSKGPGYPEPQAIFTRHAVQFYIGYDTQILSDCFRWCLVKPTDVLAPWKIFLDVQ